MKETSRPIFDHLRNEKIRCPAKTRCTEECLYSIDQQNRIKGKYRRPEYSCTGSATGKFGKWQEWVLTIVDASSKSQSTSSLTWHGDKVVVETTHFAKDKTPLTKMTGQCRPLPAR